MINKDGKKMASEVGVAKLAFEVALDAELKAFRKMQNAEIKYNKAKREASKKLAYLEELMKDGK